LFVIIFAEETQFTCKLVALLSRAWAGSITVPVPQTTGLFPESCRFTVFFRYTWIYSTWIQ